MPRTLNDVDHGTRERLLTCGHIVIFRAPFPDRGEAVWCLRCDEPVKVYRKPWRTKR